MGEYVRDAIIAAKAAGSYTTCAAGRSLPAARRGTEMVDLHAGAWRADMTPPLGIPLAGYWAPRPAQGIS